MTNMKIIGFTGTKMGMTGYQQISLLSLLRHCGATEFHHGDCVGSDKQAHDIAVILGLPIIIHPPVSSKLRAFCLSETILPPKDYLLRNHDIVAACDMLIACPMYDHEEVRSGTWATVRHARKRQKPITILYPRVLLHTS